MRTVLILVLLVICSFVACADMHIAQSTPANSDGKGCAICVFGLTIVSNEIKKGAKDISKLLSGVCHNIKNDILKRDCEDLIHTFGPVLIDWLLKKEEPDWICSKVKLCKSCHLVYDSDKYYTLPREERAKLQMDDERIHESQLRARTFAAIFESQFVTQPFNKLQEQVVSYPNIPPKVDLDKDGFSSAHLCHRGADWRGKDCHDLHSKIHPGAGEDAKATTDYNCNGIFGYDHNKDSSYETQFCKSYSNDRTLVFFGDSATAGFSIPVEWVSVNLTDVLPALVNELDWPSKSYASGWTDDISNRSLYLKFRNLNRCVHRQFINVAVNGATMADFAKQVEDVKFTENWKPVLAFAGYIGNDICHNTLAEMTTVETFRANLLAGLTALNSKVAPGSKVILWGLVDGTILWNNTHNLIHPIGNGVTYAQFYKFLTCTGMNPCSTWLTDDADSRAAATKRALELDAVVEDFVHNYQGKFSNLELGFLDFSEMLQDGFNILAKEGLPLHELIDDVDGFHPSIKVGHRILADVIFDHLQERYPHFVGASNPNNAAIEARFKDQGGY